MNQDCIFCKIVAGELPACKVYEDKDTLAFMDIGPIIKGHTLVIPKEHWADIHTVPPTLLQKIALATQKIAAAHVAALKCDGVNIIQANGAPAGQTVFHLHFHVIPRFKTDGHSWNWHPRSYAGRDEMEGMAELIRKHTGK